MNNSKPEKPDVGKVLLQEITEHPGKKDQRKRSFWNSIRIPVLAIFTGLVLSALLIGITSENVYAAFGVSFGAGLKEFWHEIITAYGALFAGSLGNPATIISALKSGDQVAIREAFNPFLESLVQSTPYIFGGLAVAVGFRAGLFNIGVEGQIFIGAACATFVGYSITGLPAYIHMPLAFLAGALGGAIWGFIPGLLKATTGGHEVINTIMLNWISFRLTEWLLSGPMNRPGTGGMPISPLIQETAQIPQFFKTPIRFHLGFFIALGVAWLMWWILFKTTWGLNLRLVGTNPRAARYAGVSVIRSTVIGMALSGALAGMAGANQILAINRSMALGLSSGYGFDSIALALLGNTQPLGVVLASLLFGTLRNGATKMMVVSQIPIDIISILQAIIVMFVAAPAIIRSIYRLRKPEKEEATAVFLTGWGGGK